MHIPYPRLTMRINPAVLPGRPEGKRVALLLELLARQGELVGSRHARGDRVRHLEWARGCGAQSVYAMGSPSLPCSGASTG